MKFDCLRDAARSCQTVEDMDAAWSELSTAEIKELVGGGRNGEGGKTLFESDIECSPLHNAAFRGNSISMTYLLVSIRVAKSEDSSMIRHLDKFSRFYFKKRLRAIGIFFFRPKFPAQKNLKTITQEKQATYF